MAKGWKCDRCSTQNDAGAYNCSNCGLIRGSVVVPGTYKQAPANVLLESSTQPESTASPPPPPSPSPVEGAGAPYLEPSVGEPTAGWTAPAPPVQAPARPLWRRIPLRVTLVGALILAGVVASWITNASRSSTGDITKSGDLTSNDLRVGDCWDIKEPSASAVENVTARPCAESHKYEVFYVGSLPAGDYPTEAAFSSYVETACVPAFEAYIGMAYTDSALDVSWLYPDSVGWTAGDRTVECSAYDPGDSGLTASVKGSRH